MSRIAVIAASGLALLAAAVPVQAANRAVTASGQLRITAAHSGYVTWHLREPVHLGERNFEISDIDAVVSRTGDFGGLVIYKGRQELFGLISDREVPAPLLFGRFGVTLRPGAYTVLVLGDRAVSLDLPLPGTAHSYTLTVGGRRPNIRRYSRDTTSASPVLGLGYGSIPFDYPQGGSLALAYTVWENSAQASDVSSCIATDARPCNATNTVEGGDFTLASPGSVGNGWIVSETFAYSGEIPSGHYYASGRDEDVAVSARSGLVLYVLP